MKIYETLIDLYTTVVGKKPQGRTPSTSMVSAAEHRLRSHVLPDLAPRYPTIPIPPPLIHFLSLFGGEPALVDPYYRIFPVERIVGTIGHIAFADDQRAGRWFGIDHLLLRFEDPPVEAVKGRPSNDDGDWEDYSDHLSECLVQFACWNLQQSLLPYDLVVTDTDEVRFQQELATFRSIPITDSSPAGMQCRSYYAPGTIICYESFAKTALLGFDSLQRAIQFQHEHQWKYDGTLVDE